MATAGYLLALRVRFAFPAEEVNALPADWVREYTRNGYMMADPCLHWAFSNEGVCRWSELDDPQGVLKAAARRGLRYGAVASTLGEGTEGIRSYGVFMREDREFSDRELDRLLRHLLARHAAGEPPANVTEAEIEALQAVKDGKRLKQIAHDLGVTEGAIKQRLKNARIKLDAKTGTEAVAKASSYGMI